MSVLSNGWYNTTAVNLINSSDELLTISNELNDNADTFQTAVNGLGTQIQKVITENVISVALNNWTNIGSLNLSAGTWLISTNLIASTQLDSNDNIISFFIQLGTNGTRSSSRELGMILSEGMNTPTTNAGGMICVQYGVASTVNMFVKATTTANDGNFVVANSTSTGTSTVIFTATLLTQGI